MEWEEEEDNNPYASFDRRDSDYGANPSSPPDRAFSPPLPGSEDELSDTQTVDANAQHTPPSGYGSPVQHATNPATQPRDAPEDARPARGKERYDSRIEQILYEHPDLVISITHAGKNLEGGGSYIAYTIRTADLEVRRRYSDFFSLRQTLVNLHPTLIVPPIPEKHSMADYAAKPTKAKEDEAIIDHRKRMLTSFLNRCKRMEEIVADGVFWKFLDPNASWTEVLHSYPITSIPKNNLKAPPLDPANPSTGHNFLPVPSAAAKLKGAGKDSLSASGTPTSPPSTYATTPSMAAHSTPGPQIFGKFPPSSHELSEEELDPYFVSFEGASKELETLLQGNMDKVNKRTISHLNAFSEDLAELGARFNGFSLSEQSATLAAAVEKIGQAVDSTYIATGDLSSSLSASFSEPMRESAQFAGIVRSVLRYRILKRVQEEMTRDELDKKRQLLDQLERSELESQRLSKHLENSGYLPSSPPRRSASTSSARSPRSTSTAADEDEDSAIDSRATQSADISSSSPQTPPSSPPQHRKSASGGFVANKIFGRINHAIHGVMDMDPEKTRRDQIGKTKESLGQLEQALEVSEKDVRNASAGVLKSLRRFQGEKEEDLRRYMLAYAKCHIDWAKSNLASWEEAKQEVERIDVR